MLPQLVAQPVGLLFKRLLLLFWTMFFTIISLTNLVDFLGEVGVLDWTFLDSNNFGYVQSVVDVYNVGDDVTKLLLLGALAIESVGAVLFARALLALREGGIGMRAALLAVCWGLMVWTASSSRWSSSLPTKPGRCFGSGSLSSWPPGSPWRWYPTTSRP